MKGVIKLHEVAHGFGFITGEDGKDYYTQFQGLSADDKAQSLKGKSVTFDLVDGLRGDEAINLVLI